MVDSVSKAMGWCVTMCDTTGSFALDGIIMFTNKNATSCGSEELFESRSVKWKSCRKYGHRPSTGSSSTVLNMVVSANDVVT